MPTYSGEERVKLIMWYMHNSPEDSHDLDSIAQALGIRSNSVKSTFYDQYRNVFYDKKPGGRHKALVPEVWPDDEAFDLEEFPDWAQPILFKALPHLKPKESIEEKKTSLEHFTKGLIALEDSGIRSMLGIAVRYNHKDKESIEKYFRVMNMSQAAIILLKIGRSPYLENKLKEYVEGDISEEILMTLTQFRDESRKS